uniref:ATPase family, AAA domain containing 5a n=1 Tax=Nothobranchius furzeri TaxID=105023 RepID=A0A8C6LMY6_NOTFU
MVTISFEDFVRSQKRTEEEMNEDKSQEEDFKVSAETQESNSEKLDASKAEVVPAQVSPRTVTIQAEVYVVSAKQKVASIFNRRKASSSPVEIVEDETPAPASTVKRKSNVVLQEEDLELSVIESESTPKCSEAERKQFMAAFKQPSLDGSKAKAVKSQPKQKPGEEKTSEAAGGDVVISPSVEHVTQENEAAEKKPTRRGRRKAKDEKEAVPSSPAASVEETVLIDKEEEPPIDSAPALRRSRREAAVRNTPETTQTSPVRKSRRLKESKDAASPQDSPVKKSTPKTRRSKHGVFVAEMVGPPDAKESPIRWETFSVPTLALKGSKKQKQAKKLVEKAKMIHSFGAFQSQSLMEDDVCWDLLMDSRCRGVDLLYSNMETLLPLPVTRLITSKLSKPERRVSPTLDRPNQQLVSTSLQSDSLLESEDGSPIKVSNRMKKKKRRHPRGRDGLQSGSDSEDGFPSICRQKINPQTEQAPVSVSKMIKRKPLTEDERRKSLPVSQCLESIADFWDSMSYVDSALRFHPDGVHRGTPLSSAVIKDGMLDESRVETGRGSWLVGRRVLEIQAAVEALSFQKCRVSVMEAWDRGKEAAEELALPVATPFLWTICQSKGNIFCPSSRFLHYLDAIHLGVEKSSLALLAEDFP